ncbi:adenine nucleotide transporter BT1, chloroplastic/mitochondrial-like [Dioscorea cayenensis subsp. rotundata]|uniref:Adenine nucleotide transporter BT1, chloroplastic/mitochondrial-like n=1 Tax=Dioscorea cayennensis subsp. rotundata TaxID=55577 RepID=A0AB40CRR6_DIOCR|nr:adenine nucleotide transporter BT1, chloroplastic/mitochondrial-like [Dioscorea cayenensis subsp. rotundata]XP_039142766.1 adenine nucleotide transporter BT1, chloroplastic/mitochondrial-like [Dioscorea cayenensis subsp. rotundata]
MGNNRLQAIENKKDGFLAFPGFGFSWNTQEEYYHPGGLFASVGQVGVGFGISPDPPNPKGNDGIKIPCTDLYVKYVSPEFGFRIVGNPPAPAAAEVVSMEEEVELRTRKKRGFKFKIRVANPSFRRLISGAIAGAVSRTAVAPLETIRTHLMVGSSGESTTEVFHNIMKVEGWKGLFRGNLVNVIRVAPSKAIELFAFDTVNKVLSPKDGEPAKMPVPSSLVAGAIAGVSSTLSTYPLELLKTRLTIQRGVYENLLHAFIKIVKEEGPAELYRGLTPSLIGVVPYAATNYYAYDTLKKVYRKVLKQEDIGNIATLLIGSAAAAVSSSATFPLEVARKHMQAGAVGGRQVYKNMLHALLSILEQEGIGGLYKGLGPSCMKLVPAAGISFMCYEACKRILTDKDNDA